MAKPSFWMKYPRWVANTTLQHAISASLINVSLSTDFIATCLHTAVYVYPLRYTYCRSDLVSETSGLTNRLILDLQASCGFRLDPKAMVGKVFSIMHSLLKYVFSQVPSDQCKTFLIGKKAHIKRCNTVEHYQCQLTEVNFIKTHSS